MAALVLGPRLRNKIAVDGRPEVEALEERLEKRCYVVVCCRHEENVGCCRSNFFTSFDVDNRDLNDHDANNQNKDVWNE